MADGPTIQLAGGRSLTSGNDTDENIRNGKGFSEKTMIARLSL
jgi:tryptophan synthase alpha subunit